MRNRMFFKGSYFPAGPAPHPSAPPSDAGDNPPWDSDDERDFAEHAYSPSPMSHYPGSLDPFPEFTGGKHLDVALWESVPQEDLSGGC